MSIYEEIRKERCRQDEEWGGSNHDDSHKMFDWIAYLTKHTGKAVLWDGHYKDRIIRFRNQMIRIAALAIAAIEWVDRQITPDTGGRGKRRYDGLEVSRM